MLIEHEGKTPEVPASAYVAPTAVVSGDVTIGEDARILFGAVITADGGPVTIGRETIVMENALVRGRQGNPARLGDHVIVGPHAHINGAMIEENAFLATGVSILPGARIGAGAEVRINGVVHVNTVVPPNGLVPIGWVAVGDPAEVFPPEEHDRIWEIQERLDFPGTVFGLPRARAEILMREATRRYSEQFGRHLNDRVID
jgi:carbonic anhydrase/acetyltransferase-like protein (isoleucine patch superfamily)